MLTRCPACQTLFRIRAETLRVAQGRVRCGRCGAEFNALDSLAEDPDDLNGALAAEAGLASASAAAGYPAGAVPGQVAAEASGGPEMASSAGEASDRTDRGADIAAAAETQAAADGGVGARPEDAAGAHGAEPGTAGPAADAVPGEAAATPPAVAPELLQSLLLQEEPARSRAGPRIAAGLVAVLLLGLLGGQWLYLQRMPLYDAQPALRPVLERLCGRLGCDLPLARAPERIEVVGRTVREHPRVAQALLVDVTFVSRAEGRVAYPLLELRLADLSGNRVAARRFTPAEYLPDPAAIAAGLAANRPVQVTLELLNPSYEVVSFQFDFL